MTIQEFSISQKKYRMPTLEEKHLLNSLDIIPEQRECTHKNCRHTITPRFLASSWCPSCGNKIGLSAQALNILENRSPIKQEDTKLMEEKEEMTLNNNEKKLLGDIGKDLGSYATQKAEERQINSELSNSIGNWVSRFFLLGAEKGFPILENFLDKIKNAEITIENAGESADLNFIIEGGDEDISARIFAKLDGKTPSSSPKLKFKPKTEAKSKLQKVEEPKEATSETTEQQDNIESATAQYPQEVKAILDFMQKITVKQLRYYVNKREKGINAILLLVEPFLTDITETEKEIARSFELDEILGLIGQVRPDLHKELMRKKKNNKKEGLIWLKILYKKIMEELN